MMSVKPKVVLTVDIEASIAGASWENEAHTLLVHELVARVVNGESEALSFLVKTLSGNGLVATFFVEATQTRYLFDRVRGGYA